jgi:hypothetical protein
VPELNDEDYADVASQDVVEKIRDRDPLRDEELDALRSLKRLEFEFLSRDASYLVVKGPRDGRPDPPHSARKSVPRAYVRMLLAQIDEKVEEHPVIKGLMVPARGYAEMICSRLSVLAADRVFRLEPGDVHCSHKEEACALPSLPFHWQNEEGPSFKRLHLSGNSQDPCVEISNASPLALLYYGRALDGGRARLGHHQIPFLATLKIAYGAALSRDRLRQNSEKIARSLSYELNIRNGVVVELDAPVVGPDISLTRRAPVVVKEVHYPRTKVQYEVSILFGFASQVTDDPPLAFLSYYQALEYFFSTFMRQRAIEAISRELRGLSFDAASTDSKQRVLRAAEGAVSRTEHHQLRVLVKEYARTSELEDFFSRDWGDYFSDSGPIRGVPAVNIKNTGQNLSDQIADRIYQVRNRIVHSKNDPKYRDRRVLLPRSAESNALTPDVLLVRLVATEAIAASQFLP